MKDTSLVTLNSNKNQQFYESKYVKGSIRPENDRFETSCRAEIQFDATSIVVAYNKIDSPFSVFLKRNA